MDTNLTVIFFLSSSVTFLSLTFSVVYFWNNFKLGTEQRLLGLVLFCVSYIYFVQHLNINFSIYFFPHLFRTGSLVGIIALSLMYLLIQKRISKEKYGIRDVFHAVPLLVYIINFTPFFVKSASEKKEILSQIKIKGLNL